VYDDGFAQVVHCNQPTTIDAATLQPDRIAPGSDAGVQVGWDDEQVTAWLNGQLDLLRVRVDPGTYHPEDTPEAPLGVQGYRVDVRMAGQQAWASLCAVQGTLPFNDAGGRRLRAQYPARPRRRQPARPGHGRGGRAVR
jgi:hypothetical protein